MKRLLALCLALVFVAGMFAGCTTTKNPTSVVINLGSEPPEMNSILTTSTGSMNVLRHIVDGLTILDQNDEAAPGMATEWTVSDDGLTYTFKLRKDAKWSNGEPVTANDFVFAWNTHFTAATAAQYAETWAVLILGAREKLYTLSDEEYAALSDEEKAANDAAREIDASERALLDQYGYDDVGYKAIDDYTLQVTTTHPYPYFLSVLAFPSLMPINEKGYNEIGADNYGTEADYILTNGAYTLKEWNHENSITLEKNPNYWDAKNIKIDEIKMEMIADSGTALNAFKAGEVDMVGLTGEQSALLKSEGEHEVQTYDDGSAWYFQYNTVQPGLSNAKVRKALTLAIDAQAFIDNVVKNSSTVAYSFVPPAINNGEFTAAVGKLIERVDNDDYSSVKALLEEGLAEEGMTVDDLTVAIVTDEGDTAAKNCAFFQEQWKVHLGVNVTVEQMTYKSRLERMQNKEFSVVMAGWGPDYNDPMTFMDLWTSYNGNNDTSWANPTYDKLIEDAIVEPDAATRQALLVEAEKLLIDEMPIGPIYNRRRDFVTSDGLTGVVRTAFDDMNLRWASMGESK